MREKMLIEMLDKETRQRIADRLEGWELVDFLQVEIEDVIDAFEDLILNNLDDVQEFIGMKNSDDEEE